MPPKFNRATERFRIFGIDLNSPVDALRPGHVPITENLRSYTDGILEPRQGLTAIVAVSSSGKTPMHSVRRLNDPNSGNYQRIVGVQDTLSYGTTTFTRATYNGTAVALSGNPLSLVPYRPDQSPASWMYIGDSTAVRKIIGNNSQSITVGTVHQVGVAAPTAAPTLTLGVQTASELSSTAALGTAPNDWETDNVVFLRAGNPILLSRIPTGLTTTRAVFDDNRTTTGGPGWCSLVVPDSFIAVVGVGQMFGIITGGPVFSTLLIHDVFTGSAATSVGSIRYDNSPANTGFCVIQPTKPLKEIKPNSVVLLNGATYARVIDVIKGPNETLSFRTHTGTTPISSAQALQVVPCVRVYDSTSAIAPAGGEVIRDASSTATGTITVTGAGTAATKTGWVQITPVTPLDLTAFTLNGTGNAIADDDYMHLSLRLSDLSKLVQGRIMFDVDTTSISISSTATAAGTIRVTTATNHELATGDTVFINTHNASTNGTWIITRQAATTFDLDGSAFVANAGAVGTVRPQFKKNFLYRTFTPNEITSAAKGTDTSINSRTTTIQRRQLSQIRFGGSVRYDGEFTADHNPDYNPYSALDPEAPEINRAPNSQTTVGDYQWSELIFRRRDLVSVGELAKRGRHHSCNAMRVELTLSDTTTVWCDLNSFTMYGGYEMDNTDLDIPYIYRYRYRVSNTGARSNWSPASQSGMSPHRGSVVVTVVAPTGAPEVDKIDIQRLGGINTNWLDIGTTPIGTLSYTDKMSDMFAIGSAPYAEDDINYQPWPILDVPFATTTTSVTGSYIVTAAALPTNLAKGTAMKVNGIDTTFRRVVSAAQLIYEIEDSLGTLTTVTVEIPAPIITSQPLPVLWIHNNRAYAVGDNKNPGVLYYTNAGDPDGVTESSKLEITATSEPLQNGCSFNGKNYVWSSERMFEIQEIAPGLLVAIDIPGTKGLFSRWALAVGERIWFLSRDGIYQTGGGDSISITDETLRPLFVREGTVGVAVNGFNPPDFTQTSKLRLSYYDGFLRFVYQDTSGALRCMVYAVRNEKPGWWPDTYLDGQGIAFFYGEEGSGIHSLLACGNDSGNAKLYTVSGTSDDLAGISCHVRTQAFDGGDRRSLKHFGDLIVDADSQGESITAVAYINNYSTTAVITPTVLSTSTGGRTQTIIDTSSGTGFEARNVALDLAWTSTGLVPKLYLWEPSFIVLPETSNLRASYWDDCDAIGDKFFQGIKITTDTSNVARTVKVEYDGGAGIGILADTLTIQHNGNIQKEYAFNPAFTAHQVRLRPTDTNSWKNFDYEWVFQPEPPKANRYETQQTSHGYDGFIHLKSLFINLSSTSAVTLTITRTEDNVSSTYTIPTTTGLKRKVYVPISSTKGKAFIYTLTATGDGFRLYKDTTDLYVKSWGSNAAYASRNPFGHSHGDGKASI